MSAFVCGHDHIDALLSFAVDKKASFYDREKECHIYFTRDTATEIGQILLRENVRSVEDRYPSSQPDDLPGIIGEDVRSYKFRYFGPKSALQVLMDCQCFDYQACETDDYEQSKACKIIDAIRTNAIRSLPGYDECEWGSTRKSGRKAA